MEAARAAYAKLGVDVDAALAKLQKVSLSIPCWQGDDVGGFERVGATLEGGGIQVTGGHPGKARTIAELRQDAEFAFSLIPGKHRFNLQASYGDFGGKFVDRDAIEYSHFAGWVEWCRSKGLGLDFNSTLFSHPKSQLTLSSKDDAVRAFWVEHVIRCRKIAAQIGKELASPCVHNIWIPDGFKDQPVDRIGYRTNLKNSLDKIFSVDCDRTTGIDAVEGKLFGIGAESYTVGSHDFYLGYSVKNNVLLCMDMGHFHPTESVADKLSAILPISGRVLLHISRPVRWDSDHVCILNDDLYALCEEIIRCDALDKVYMALDFFDASINRVGAWVIGTRTVLKGLLAALLQPLDKLREFENKGQFFERLALLEEMKTMPMGAVWEEFCRRNNVPAGSEWIEKMSAYENDVLLARK